MNASIARATLALCLGLIAACSSGLSDVECTETSDCASGICAAGQCIDLGDDTSGDVDGTDADIDVDGADTAADTDNDTGTDAADASADVADVGTDDVATDADAGGGDVGEPNLCGGFGALTWDGEAAGPGDPCGACNDGVLVCNGGSALRCTRASEPNECGGCGTLAGVPGAACGACGGGEWTCTDGNVVCSNATPRNACGGCASLEGTPGALCDGDSGARWACEGTDILVCGGAGNACGGSAELTWGEGTALPGDLCTDLCGDGQLICDGVDALRCLAEVDANACGGCGELPGAPGTTCGDCDGSWTCDEDGGAFCEEPPANACGGCTALSATPGTACDDTGGTWRCDGADAVRCAGGGSNACGGTTALEAEPGQTCGPCDNGVYECVGSEAVACSVAEDDGLNLCGGCTTLPAPPGTPCGTCAGGRWACDGADALTCSGDPGDAVLNACGGCRPLEGTVGTACGLCGQLACSGVNALICAVPDGSTCDPCEELGCAEQNRVCELIDELTGRCAGCVEGYVNDGALCRPVVTCTDLACDDEGRQCITPTGGGDATCGACLETHVEVDGACIAAECTSASACGSPVIEPGECLFDTTCATDGTRTDTVLDPVCADGFCETETSSIADVPCSRPPTDGNTCLSGAGNAGTCTDGVCVETIGTPTGVQASDGTSAAHVAITWNPVAGATGYVVYRDDAVAATLTSATDTGYLDTGAEPGEPPAITSTDASDGTSTDSIILSWTVDSGSPGSRYEYAVAAMGPSGLSSRSASNTGFRGVPRLDGFEIAHSDTTEWLSVNASRRSYADTSAAPGTITPGAPSASDGTFDAYVLLDLDRTTDTTPGPVRAYQIRVVADGEVGPASAPFSGFRGVGELSFRWFRARSGVSGFEVVNTTLLSAPRFEDYDAPADGSRREYFCRVSADGAEDADSDTDLGNRARCECGSGQVWCALGAGTCTSSRGCCAPELLGCIASGVSACSP